jgi:hypothetical protein
MISSNSSQSFSPPPDLRAQALPSFSTVASLRTCRNPRKPFLFTHLLHNLRTPRGWGYIRSTLAARNRSLVSPQPSGWAAKLFKIRTSEKCARKPRGMLTSKTLDLKLFRMSTYKKKGEGGGVRLRRYFIRPPLVLICGGEQQAIQSSFRDRVETMDLSRNRCYIACHTEGLTSSHSADHQPAGRTHSAIPKSSVPLTNHKTKASKTCSRDSWQELRLRCWPVRPPLPFARKK